nr:AraC family transcriptional regulator [uncultured Allomuricauda sp.]
MIKEHQQIELFGRKIFEKAIVSPPFRFFYGMPNEACFFYLVQGNSKLMTPNSTIQMSTHEGVVMQCGNYLADMVKGSESEYCEAVAVHLYPDVLKMIYDKEFPNFLLDLNKVNPIPIEKYDASELLGNYIESIQFYFKNPALVSEELMRLKLKELMLLLARSNNAEIIKQLISRLFSAVELDFKSVIETNIFNNLNVDELAKLANLSISSFKREFAKHYKDSPAKHIRKRKLEKASKLLKGTDLRVSDIAYDCGFPDLPSFSKSFVKHFSVSPTEFRVNHKSNSLG